MEGFHSDSKCLDGKEINFDEFLLMYIGNGFENLDPNKFEINNENEGFPLEEKTFIKEQIVKYEYISKDTEGSVLDRTVHLKCELYLNHLRMRLGFLETSPGSSLNKKVEPSSVEFIGTRSQIALFYVVLQNAGLKARFKAGEKVKDIRKICPQLIIEKTGVPITEKSFQLKYNEISNNKAGYSGEDYNKVEKVINERYPEALEELKNFFRRDLF